METPPRQALGATLRGGLRALLVVGLCTGISELISTRFDLANISMIYLAGVVYVSLHERPAISVATVLASIFLFDLIYVPPRWGLNPLNPAHFFTFTVMLLVGLLIGRLAAQARAQARLAAAAQLEAESQQLRNTLLSGISHDFRTPLTTIVGAATSLQQQGERLDVRMRASLADSILEQARRLDGLLANVLDLTRMEEGAIALKAEWCPADDLVAEALAAVGPRAASHAVHSHVPPEAIVWCDPGLLEQALVNLVDNALRHTPPGSRVDISVEAGQGQWHLVVADDGPGLPPGRERAIFGKFQHARTETAGAGFGLGLAICAAVAKLHGGTIEARNVRGACFVLTLPQPARVPLEDL